MGVGRGMATPPVEVDLDDKEDDLYTMDEKSEGEGVDWVGGGGVVIEESGGGGVGIGGRATPTTKKSVASVGATQLPAGDGEVGPDTEVNEDEELDGDGEEVEMSDNDKGEEYGWEEGFEQEV